jgi:GTPase
VKQGLTESTICYIKIAHKLDICVITILTHIDLITEEELEAFIKDYKYLIKSLKLSKLPVHINTKDDVNLFSRNLDENIHPIFTISSKSGVGYELLLYFISLLTNNNKIKNNYNPTMSQFDIHEYFSVDKKIIIGGFVSKGRMVVNEKYYLGPDKNGNFK